MTAPRTPAPSTARATARPRAAARRAAPRGGGDAAPPKKAPAKKKPPARERATTKSKPKAAKPKKPGNVSKALEGDLKKIAELDQALADSALAASARILALEMDDPDNTVTSKLTCARELRETLTRLRELVPDEQEDDELADIRARRAKRLAGRATA